MPRLGARAARASFAVMLASALLLSAFNLRADEGLTAALAGLRSESADERRAAAQAVESFGSSGNDAVTSIAKQLMDVERTGESRIPRLAAEPRPGAGKDPDLVEMLVHERPEPSVTRALVTLCSCGHSSASERPRQSGNCFAPRFRRAHKCVRSSFGS